MVMQTVYFWLYAPYLTTWHIGGRSSISQVINRPQVSIELYLICVNFVSNAIFFLQNDCSVLYNGLVSEP